MAWDDPSGGISSAISDQYNLAQIPIVRAQLPRALAEAQLAQLQAQKEQIGLQQMQQEQQVMQQYMAQRRAAQAGAAPAGAAPAGVAPGAAPGVAPGAAPGATPGMDDFGIANMLDTEAGAVQALMDNGLFTAANARLGKLTQQYQQVAAARNSQTNAQLHQVQTQQKIAEALHEATLGIKDEKTLQQARESFMAEFPGQPLPPYLSLPYAQAKPLIEQVKTYSKEGMNAAKTQAQIIQSRAAAAHSAESTRLARVTEGLRAQQIQTERMRTDLLKKRGDMLGAGADVDSAYLPPGVTKEDIPKYLDPNVSTRIGDNNLRIAAAGARAARNLDALLLLPPGITPPAFIDMLDHKDPNITGALKKFAASKMTPEQQKMAQAAWAQMSTEIATIANLGNVPRMAQLTREESAQPQPGDDMLTVLRKTYDIADMAHEAVSRAKGKTPTQAAQIAEAAKSLDEQRQFLAKFIKTVSPQTQLRGYDESPATRLAKQESSAKSAAPKPPAGLPKGATFVKNSPDGKPVYRLPDGQMVVPE